MGKRKFKPSGHCSLVELIYTTQSTWSRI